MPLSKRKPDRGKLIRGRDPLVDQLDAMENLKDGWDSYSATAPKAVAIKNAKALLKAAQDGSEAVQRVEPSAMGGVGISFAAGDREVVVEFYNNGTAHALFADDSTGEMHTQAVATNLAGYRRIVGHVRKYLHDQ